MEVIGGNPYICRQEDCIWKSSSIGFWKLDYKKQIRMNKDYVLVAAVAAASVMAACSLREAKEGACPFCSDKDNDPDEYGWDETSLGGNQVISGVSSSNRVREERKK